MADIFGTLGAMESDPSAEEMSPMPLAENLRKFRDEKGLSLDDVARKSRISKAYLWELERDTQGEKKPSADVLMRIAAALSKTLAELLDLPTVQADHGPVELPPSLRDFQRQMEAMGTPLTDNDLRDLAAMKFRGSQPETAGEWHQLYLLLDSSTRRRKT